MALTRTSTSAAITASQTQNLGITSTSTGFPAVGVIASPPQVMQIDNEKMLIQVVPVANTVNVMQRGYNGTIAVAHDILAPVATSSSVADFQTDPWGAVDTRMPYLDDLVTVGQNGAIAVPIKNTTVVLTKATALSSTTLAAPAKDQDGIRLVITSATAAAHVITAVGLLADAVSGSPHGTATYAAFIGASLTLEACNSLWNVISSVGVTIT